MTLAARKALLDRVRPLDRIVVDALVRTWWLSEADVAGALGISVHVLRKRRQRAYAAIQVASRRELLVWYGPLIAPALGWVE